MKGNQFVSQGLDRYFDTWSFNLAEDKILGNLVGHRNYPLDLHFDLDWSFLIFREIELQRTWPLRIDVMDRTCKYTRSNYPICLFNPFGFYAGIF